MLEKVVASIEVLDANSNYWFVRTDGGQYFSSFFQNNFIGIGWNEITLADLKRPEYEVKTKIARVYKLDSKVRADRAKVTDIYNKIVRFTTLRKNDVVVIPSENSEYLSFGVIDDQAPFEVTKTHFDCPYLKRRKIKWINNEPRLFSTVDDAFYKIRKSRHAISIIDEYADFVDSAMYSVYKKEDTSHFVVNVKKQGEINWKELGQTLVDMHTLMAEINTTFKLDEDIANSSIQIALQSPGLFNLCQKGIALILLATALGASSCSEVKNNLSRQDKDTMNTFENTNKAKIDTIKQKLSSMNVRL